MRPGRRSGRAALAVLVGVALLVGAVGALAGPASAGDTAGALSVSPESFDVEPGDTVAFEVAMVNDGERDDDGVYGLTLRLDYPSEYLTVTEIESADWFREAPSGDDRSQPDVDVSESVEYDDERGAARLSQSLDDPTTGVTGEAVVATVTVRVEPDAEPAVAELGTRETSTDLTSRRDYPQPLATPSVTFNVSGGGDGEVVTPDYDDAAFADTDDGESASDGDTDGGDASDGNASGNTDANEGEEANGSDGVGDSTGDEAPAPVGGVLLGVVAAALLLARR
ncbi:MULTISPECIES: cellulosome anchoring protein cohesin region [Halorubrum]|uniref:Cellulosome anchoring protein cohesin region n=1 Tax=Halorubrum hochstenium ATCC 700873 TaxID=1227481 RepID=M0FNC8_9EURY|nr:MULTISPECIES: cellulosome anchoring protein cohesin region [Halorubrum]ELZ61521.1 cellulosome anchoring protein cohesin region [Halorubrum hochstenium ATCC 700873]